MSNLIHHTGNIPTKEKLKAIWQIVLVFICYFFPWALTFILAPLVIWTSKKTTNQFGEVSEQHSPKYIEQGSSGMWYYVATAVKWLAPWNNLEDGLYGEPSGKHSARVGGKEASFKNMYAWLIRNPFNQGKRLSRFFSCYVDDCIIEYWGQQELSDKDDLKTGWYWVKATDQITGKTYYGFRHVESNHPNTRPLFAKIAIKIASLFNNKRDYSNTVYNAVFGFKIQPRHALEVQGDDDKDKAFTARVQFASTID